MPSDFRSALVSMCRSVLYPLIQIAIRFGVSAGEFKAIVDSVYAHAGSEYLELSGEKASYSKLAVITGINRTFLPELLLTPKDDFKPRSNTQVHRAARVLTGWYEDQKFCTKAGSPAVLNIEGESGRTFRRLCAIYSGDVYYQTMLSELERIGAAQRIGNHKVRALRRTAAAEGANVDSIAAVGELAGDLLATLEHNFRVGPEEALPVSRYVAPASEDILPLFRQQLMRRADGLIEAMETLLQSHSAEEKPTNQATQAIELGAAVFVIRRNSRPEKSKEKIAKPRR